MSLYFLVSQGQNVEAVAIVWQSLTPAVFLVRVAMRKVRAMIPVSRNKIVAL